MDEKIVHRLNFPAAFHFLAATIFHDISPAYIGREFPQAELADRSLRRD